MRIRRPTVAEVLALAALLLACSGSAVAASRYLITSPSQIKPSVLRSIARASRGETAEPSSAWAFSAGNPVVSAFARCPAGFEDVSGGYGADLPPEWKITTEAGNPEGWRVTAVSSAEHPAQQAKLKVTAYCRSKP